MSPESPTEFVHSHVVRYHEVDPQQHVYHARFLEIADVGFSEYLAALLGASYSELGRQGLDPALVATSIVFASPAAYEDVLDVRVRPLNVGNSSFVMQIEISKGPERERVVRLETTYVNFDSATSTSRPVPPDMAETLRTQIQQGTGSES